MKKPNPRRSSAIFPPSATSYNKDSFRRSGAPLNRWLLHGRIRGREIAHVPNLGLAKPSVPIQAAGLRTSNPTWSGRGRRGQGQKPHLSASRLLVSFFRGLGCRSQWRPPFLRGSNGTSPLHDVGCLVVSFAAGVREVPPTPMALKTKYARIGVLPLSVHPYVPTVPC